VNSRIAHKTEQKQRIKYKDKHGTDYTLKKEDE